MAIKIFGIKIGGKSKEVPINKKLGQVYVTPAENKKTYGAGVTVVGSGGSTTSGNKVSSPSTSATSNVPSRSTGGRSGGSRGGTSNGGLGGDSNQLTNQNIIIPENLRNEVIRQADLRKVTNYNPRTGSFETYNPNQRGTTIVNSRLPTAQEQKRIDVLESYGVTANLDRLKDDIKSTQTTNEKIKVVSGKIDKVLQNKIDSKGEFTGTPEEYSEYQKLYNEAKVLESKKAVTDRTINFSFFGQDNKVKASELSDKGLNFQIFNRVSDSVTRGAGSGIGQLYGDTLGKIKVGKRPDVVIDRTTGIVRTGTERDRQTLGGIFSSKDVGNVAGNVFGATKYFVPYVGQGLFFSEVGEGVSRSGGVANFIRENPVEVGLITGGLFLGGAYAGAKIIRNKGITSAVTKELELLEGTKLKSLTLIDEGAGKITARAYRETPTGYQVVNIAGRLEKTDKGLTFMPFGKGTSRTVVVANPTKTNLKLEFTKNELGQFEQLKGSFVKRPTGDSYFTQSGQSFFLASKGAGLKRGQIGRLRFSESVGTQISVPVRNVFGQVKVPETKFELFKSTKDLAKQLKKDRPLGDIIIDVKLPTGQADFIQIKKGVGLKYSKAEEGIVVNIPKKVETNLIGFTGKGQKSSEKYFKSLYRKPSEKVISKKPALRYTRTKTSQDRVLKEVFPDVEAVAKRGIETTRQTLPKADVRLLSGLPVGGSVFEGTNQYEQNIEFAPQNFVSVSKQNVLVDTKQSPSLKPVSIISSKGKGRSREDVKPAIKLDLGLKSDTAQRSEVKSRLSLKELLKTKQEERQLFKPVSQSKIKPQIGTPKIKVKTETPFSDLFKSLKKSNEEFEVFGKRFGEDLSLGFSRTKAGAKEKLKNFLVGTLGRSGKVKQDGKELTFEELGFNEQFRPAKKDPSRIVQKAKFSLGTSGERSEIQMFKRKSKSTKKRKKSFDWFS